MRQIGGPEWIRQDIYIINAKYPDDVPRSPENTRAMIRALLADRFKLVGRDEERDLPIYDLVFARDDKRFGPKLQAFTVNCQAPSADRQQCGSRASSGPGMMLARNQPIGQLVSLLQFAVGRTVVDRTGLSGQFNFDVAYAADERATPELPSLFTALSEQLGLKLEAARGPVHVLVIDSIERPTED